MLKKTLSLCAIATVILAGSTTAQIRINTKAASAINKGVSAATFSDADAAKLAKESVDWMDAHNPVAGPKDKYAIRLKKLVAKYSDVDGLKLNFKVYKVVDINAFACADGSVRVFSSLMDMMTDDELLSVIGHEIGHVKNHDTRDAIRQAYMRAAVGDAAASQSGVVATLSDTQLASMAEALMDSKYSRKQETEADNYGYEFLKKNNVNVMAMSSAFKKLASLSSGADQTKGQKMFNSHPDSNKRAAAIEAKAKKDGLVK